MIFDFCSGGTPGNSPAIDYRGELSARCPVGQNYVGHIVIHSFGAGERSYLRKDVRGQESLNTVRALHAGPRPLPPQIASRLAEGIQRME